MQFILLCLFPLGFAFEWYALGDHNAELVDPKVPKFRYSHCAAVIAEDRGTGESCMFLTHGFNNRHEPDWRSDSYLGWSARAERWRRLLPVSGEGGVPSARYGASMIGMGVGKVMLMGGDDGGASSMQGGGMYRAGSYLRDIWEALVEEGDKEVRWRKVGELEGRGRSLHGMAGFYRVGEGVKKVCGLVATEFELWAGVVFGGLVAGEDGKVEDTDEMILNAFDGEGWKIVERGDGNWPSRRHGASVGSDGDVFIVFGGAGLDCVEEEGVEFTNSLNPNKRPCLLNDLWRLQIDQNSPRSSLNWVKLPQPPKPQTSTPVSWPRPRVHAAMSTVGKGQMVLFGGGHCEPSCTCLCDTWLLDVDSGSFSSIATDKNCQQLTTALRRADNVPAPRYRHTLVSWPNSQKAYLFGGESYNPSTYYNDFWEIRQHSSFAFNSQSLYTTLFIVLALFGLIVSCYCVASPPKTITKRKKPK